MRVMITGASGFIGEHILRCLLKNNIEVVAAVRNPAQLQSRYAKVEAIAVDFQRDSEITHWLPLLNNIDVVINAVGIIAESHGQSFSQLHQHTPCALFAACEKAGVKKVIQISALGAQPEALSRYFRTKAAADNCLETSQLDWVILQPSLVYGRGGKSTSLFQAMAALPILPLVDHGQQQVQPVHVDDLIHLVLTLLHTNNITHQRLPVVGPQAMSFKRMLQYFRQGLGLSPGWSISIPYWLAYFNASVLEMLGQKMINRENIRMLQQGSTADCQAMRDATGRTPRSMAESLTDEVSGVAERQRARSYFLQPMLRISLALLWIISGLVSTGVYPLEQSLALLESVGVPDSWQLASLYSASLLDVALGIALLLGWQIRRVAMLQIMLMLIYSLIIMLQLPQLLAHPFAPLVKNFPLIVATFVVIAWAEK